MWKSHLTPAVSSTGPGWIERGRGARGRMLKSRWKWKGIMSASDYRSGESKCGVSLIARKEIHGHANLLLLGAKGVIQHLRDHWFSNSPLSVFVLVVVPLLYTFRRDIMCCVAGSVKSEILCSTLEKQMRKYNFTNIVLLYNLLWCRSEVEHGRSFITFIALDGTAEGQVVPEGFRVICVCVLQNCCAGDLLRPNIPAVGFDPAPLLRWSHSGWFAWIYQQIHTHSHAQIYTHILA